MEARTTSPPKEQEQREREMEPVGWAPMQADAEWSGLGVVERSLTELEPWPPLSEPLVEATATGPDPDVAPRSDLFMGMIFASTGLPADALDSARFLVRSRGGVWRDLPPVGGGDWWNVVSVTGAAALLRTPGEIAVTDVWLTRCTIENKLFEPSECGAWTPVSVSGAQSVEWKRCRIGVTNLDELDREEIGKIVAGFGARYTENFTRRNTHLIAATLSEPYGAEYSRKREMAQKWGVPIVSRQWLFESCRAGRPLDVQAYRLPDQLPQETDTVGQEGQSERPNIEHIGGGAAGVLDTRGIKRVLESPAKLDGGGGGVGVGAAVNPPATPLPEVLSRNLARAGGRFANPPANPPDFRVAQAHPPSTPEARLPPSQMNRVRVFLAHKTTENNRDKLTGLVTDMGAEVVSNLSDATHAVFGRTRGVEATQDFVAAMRRRLNIVSEYWLVKSRELGTWQPEAKFPHMCDPAPVSAAELSNPGSAAPLGEVPSSRADSGNSTNVATAVEVPPPPPSAASTSSALPPTTSASVAPPVPPPRRTRMDIAAERREAINAKVLDLIADMPAIPARVKRRRMDEPTTDASAFVPPQPPPGHVFPRDSEIADLPPGSPPRIKPIPKLEIPTVTWHDPEIKNIKKRLMDMVSGGTADKRAKADPASASRTGEAGAGGKGKEPAMEGAGPAAGRAPEPSWISVSRDSVSNVSTKSGPLTPPDPISANTDKKRSATGPEERQGLKLLASYSTASDITPGGDAGTMRRHGRPVARPGATTTNSASLTTVTTTSGPSSVTPPSNRSPPKFLFSAVDNASRPRFKAVLERCGALVYDTNAGWKPDLTHLVVGKVAPTTDKLLAAVAAGAWVLKPSYIDACSRANSLVPEEPHEWPPESSPGTVLGYARHWRTTLSPHLHIGPGPRPGAFSAVRAYLVAGEMTRVNVVRVLKTGGVTQMEIGKAPFKIADKSAFTHVLVDLNVRKSSNSEWKVLLKSGVPCYELQAFLTAVLTGGDGEGAKLR
ncbi:hypothetical protein M427DRAFT_58329 [Gonapodya prolifera JEL478]|uniref:BRCT domain-containing protein n=1 Tax=Gonapodya prolifera (strain JEL478) TaxID=1344416 RepID=A0A139AAN7_GONPJ|nr:hypothetical protein M427DRAFT_58329 [Gonapodya prolifera JEL478]|eukprot:KXS13734.1 hypothetical protein M427DRAFT_58329 [Gonapodya prolifera JEL478]